jgi:hypothetical protein
MICLLRAGIGSEQEVSRDSTQEALDGSGHFGVYEVLTVPNLKLNPAWDPLRNDTRFQKLCEEKQP